MVDSIGASNEAWVAAPALSTAETPAAGESFSAVLAGLVGPSDPAPPASPTPLPWVADALGFLNRHSLPHSTLAGRSGWGGRTVSFFGSRAADRTCGTGQTRPMALSAYPRPAGDNGRGVHWIPTTSQKPEVVDQFVARAQELGMRWVTFLNKPDDLQGNDYLVNKLVDAGIMPVMRIYTDSGATLENDIRPLVEKYRAQGVSYFQVYNEPNLSCENQGAAPDVQSYLDRWIPAARQVVEAGGLPGFGGLSPQGDTGDLDFLRQALDGLKTRGAVDLLDHAWVSVHNYGQDYLRVRQYNQVVQSELGRSLPLIGTEAGIYPDASVSQSEQVQVVTGAYRYLQQREPYYFAYSLWTLANQAGGGHDERWERQALFGKSGPSELARALESAFQV